MNNLTNTNKEYKYAINAHIIEDAFNLWKITLNYFKEN